MFVDRSDYNGESDLNNSFLSKEELSLLREQYVIKYSKSKGWNPNNLNSNQMLEIVSSKEYKNPNLLKG